MPEGILLFFVVCDVQNQNGETSTLEKYMLITRMPAMTTAIIKARVSSALFEMPFQSKTIAPMHQTATVETMHAARQQQLSQAHAIGRY